MKTTNHKLNFARRTGAEWAVRLSLLRFIAMMKDHLAVRDSSHRDEQILEDAERALKDWDASFH